jgi:hypothetical protein
MLSIMLKIIRMMLRALSAILLLAAIWVLFSDLTTDQPSMMFGKFWFDLSPTSLQVSEAIISRYLDPCGLIVRLGCSPFLWHPLISTTLLWPAVLVLFGWAIIFFLLSIIGRKQRVPKRNQDYFK